MMHNCMEPVLQRIVTVTSQFSFLVFFFYEKLQKNKKKTDENRLKNYAKDCKRFETRNFSLLVVAFFISASNDFVDGVIVSS